MNWRLFFITTIVFILDQATKLYFQKHTVRFFQPLIILTPITNGEAFMVKTLLWKPFQGGILIILAISFLLIFLRTYKGIKSYLSFGFLFGGALGNLFDIIFLNEGRDFILVNHSFVMNVADIALTIGFFLMLLFAIPQIVKEHKKGRKIVHQWVSKTRIAKYQASKIISYVVPLLLPVTEVRKIRKWYEQK